MSDPHSGNGSRRFRVAFLPRALEDVEEAFDYIAAASSSKEIALAWLDRVMKAGLSLEMMPQRYGHARENGKLPLPLRQVVVGSHRIIYSVDAAAYYVRILRVLHVARRSAGRRDLE